MKFKTVIDIEDFADVYMGQGYELTNDLSIDLVVETHDIDGGKIIQDISFVVWDRHQNMVGDDIIETRTFESEESYNHKEHTEEAEDIAQELMEHFWDLIE